MLDPNVPRATDQSIKSYTISDMTIDTSSDIVETK